MSRKFCIRAGLVLAVLVSIGSAWDKVPRAYLGLGTVGAAGGYHGWRDTVNGQRMMWWDANAAALEARFVLNSGLGFGFRLIDGSGVLMYDDHDSLRPYFSNYVEFAPSVLWVAPRNTHGFGFFELILMPYADRASGLALDYAYVPFAPLPIEAHARLAGTVYDWDPGDHPVQVGYQASLGVRIGLGWWLLRRESTLHM